MAKEKKNERFIQVNVADIPLRLRYDSEASHGISLGYDDVSESFGSGRNHILEHLDDDWERWSLPLGNGYFGANVFGRTDTERIQLTEKTLANPYYVAPRISLGGLNNFAETFIDFGHKHTEECPVSDYLRELDLKTALSTVKYSYSGVEYSREYFTSYPDRAFVIKLAADREGALEFTLRPTIPYRQEYMNTEGDEGGKSGSVTSSVAGGVGEILLAGTLEYFNIDFAGIFKLYTDGEIKVSEYTTPDGYNDGSLFVKGATRAYIIATLATDYELCEDTFAASRLDKPTFKTTLADAIRKARTQIDYAVSAFSALEPESAYQQLRARHIHDHSSIFGRVTLDLDTSCEDFELMTDALLEKYKSGASVKYLETLYFQYGRYLLIASSRKGSLPANLQGVWNRYNKSPWSSGYWHNVNVQMNYWPAFSTNLTETFQAYADYNRAYMKKACIGADEQIARLNPEALGKDGGNGWCIATGGFVSDVDGSSSIGNLGFTTQLFWEYYDYTRDRAVLRDTVYPVLVSAAKFITKAVKMDDEGHYLTIHTDSPEQFVDGVWYYTKGTTYAQSFAYQNNYNTLLAARELGIDLTDVMGEDYEILKTVMDQLDKYDPIIVGLSGQIKEFREEKYYGDLGEHKHRHISQLVGLYPANLINGTTLAWLDAAEYSLTERGDEATGWGVAHRLNLWARVKRGERAHDLYRQLLTNNTATNLWDLHPPFQIDGNLGGTAGMSEMLLQSHAGYIEPLAAVPTVWSCGSYTGLLARGGFEVSASWQDSVADLFNIKSLHGGRVSVKYFGIEKATVYDNFGKKVAFTSVDADVISFDTIPGAIYSISGFAHATVLERPNNLSLTEDDDMLVLSWDSLPAAVSYAVYLAQDSAPSYSLIGRTDTTSFIVSHSDKRARLTIAVTAIDADGTEGKRALVYRNPHETL